MKILQFAVWWIDQCRNNERKGSLCHKDLWQWGASFWCSGARATDDADAAGLKVALDKAIAKGNFSFDRQSKGIGLGSDGTNTNKALYRLEKDEFGEHFILILCLRHELELAIHAAFEKNSKLNEDAEELLLSLYYY